MDTMINHEELLIRAAAFEQCAECHAVESEDGETPDDFCPRCPIQPFTRFGIAPDGSLLDAVKMYCRTLCGNGRMARGDCCVTDCYIYEFKGWEYYSNASQILTV
jgi:hypothetical protein